MQHPEKFLRVLLTISAAATLPAFPCALLPESWMDWTHQQLGLSELPRGPIVLYMARSLSLLYGMHGALMLFLAGDVARYLPVVRFVGLLMLGFGIAMTVIDVTAGLPWYWSLVEGPGITAYYGLLTWVAYRASEVRT